MEKTLTKDLHHKLHAASIEMGHSLTQMQELAGYHLARFTTHRFPTHSHPNVLVVSSTGESSGVGLITAKHLQNAGHTVSLYLRKAAIADSINQHMEIAHKMQIPVLDILQTKSGDVLIDSLIAMDETEMHDELVTLIKHMNDSGKPIVSFEAPSGMNPDTGEAYSAAVQPDHTVSVAAHKKGIYENPKAGVAHVYDVGIPRILYEQLNLEYPF